MAEPSAIDAEKRSIRVTLTPELSRDFDAWRRAQDRIPSAAEATRRLLARALDADHASQAVA